MSDYQNLMYGINNVIGQKITKTFCSIGSIIFLEWGDDVTRTLPSGEIFKRKEWVFQFNLSKWRITENGHYFLGSCEPQEVIANTIGIFKGKVLKSFQVISHMLDVELTFSDGFKITSFVFYCKGDPWCFMLDNSTVEHDFQTKEGRMNAYNLAKQFPIPHLFKRIKTIADGTKISRVSLEEERLFLFFRSKLLIAIDVHSWRLEKKSDLYVGHFGESEENTLNKLKELEGQELKYVEITDDMADTRFIIGDDYVLQTFASNPYDKWEIYHETPDKPVLIVKPPLFSSSSSEQNSADQN
jgi:hypothetical protein